MKYIDEYLRGTGIRVKAIMPGGLETLSPTRSLTVAQSNISVWESRS